MKALGTHQANFTWARNKYNKSEDEDAKPKYARYMAKYLAEGRQDNFTTEQITRGIDYPSEVDKYILDVNRQGTGTPIGIQSGPLFSHRGKPGWYELSGAVLEAPALVAGFDDVAVMG